MHKSVCGNGFLAIYVFMKTHQIPHFKCVCVCVRVHAHSAAQTLCDPMDCSLPSFSVHGIFPATILEWVAISFSRGSSRPRDWTHIFHTADRFFTMGACCKSITQK